MSRVVASGRTYVVHAAARPQLVAHQHPLRFGLGQLALVHRRLHLHLQVRLHLQHAAPSAVSGERGQGGGRRQSEGSFLIAGCHHVTRGSLGAADGTRLDAASNLLLSNQWKARGGGQGCVVEGAGAYLLLVLQAVAAALHVHLLGVGVVELAVAELAVEAERLAVVAADLLDVVLPHGLHLGLGVALVVLVVALLVFLALGVGFIVGRGTRDCAETPGRHECDLGRPGHRLFG